MKREKEGERKKKREIGNESKRRCVRLREGRVGALGVRGEGEEE